MSWFLVFTVLAVYVAQLIGVRHHFDALGTALAVRPGSLGRSHSWTLLTYAWAHALPLPSLPAYVGFHLVGNVVPLFCLAPIVERRIGPWLLLVLYCGGVIAAALAWIAWHPVAGDAMIGCSGALFALIATAGVLKLRLWNVDLVFFQVPLRLNLRAGAIVLCAVEVVQFFWRGMPHVAHVAHLGGALFGFLFALLIPREAR